MEVSINELKHLSGKNGIGVKAIDRYDNIFGQLMIELFNKH